MKFLIYKSICRSLAVLVSLSAAAAEPVRPLAYQLNPSLDIVSQVLTLDISDSLPSASACDYYVQSFEYLEPFGALNLKLKSPACAVERIAVRKTTFKWLLPETLRGHSSLQIVINSEILGNLLVDQNNVSFEPIKTPVVDK